MHHLLRHRLRLLMSLFMMLYTLFSSFPSKFMMVQTAQAANTTANTATSTLRLYVKSGEMGDCSSWTSACKLTTALQSAIPGSEIWVARGIYKPTASTTDRSASFPLKSDVAIYGGFAGTEETLNQRNVAANPTVLSGDIDNNDKTDAAGVVTTTAHLAGANSYHVVTGNSVTTTAVLDGFIITAGNTTGSESGGGGIYNSNSTATLTNLTFTGNLAPVGGGMYNTQSSPTLSNIVFNNNSATSNGGGIYNATSSNPVLVNVSFDGNSATHGGGICNTSNSKPALTHVTFTHNSASANGGAINNNSSSPTLSDITVNGNSASYGGGMHNTSSSPIVINATFNGNLATTQGGGIYSTGGSATLINVIFTNNSASNGGGMYNHGSNPKLTNVTFSNNSAITNGGGMTNANSSTATLVNIILWGNQASGSPQIRNNSSACNIQYSLIAGGCPAGSTCDSHLITSAPRFVDAANANLRLQGNSPAIDAGDNTAAALSAISTDRDGKPRFLDTPSIPDTGNGTAPMVDIGAYEYDPTLPTTTQLQVAPNPARYGQSIAVVASVTTTADIPVGNVTFYDGKTILGSRELSTTGTATLTTNALAVGTHPISAQYNGEGIFLPSNSNEINLVINPHSIYLPLAVNNYTPCFEGPSEREPNDSYQQANGPLCPGKKYSAYPNDAKDYFSFYLPKAGKVKIEMDRHTGKGVQMLLYYKTPVANGEIWRIYEAPYTFEYDGDAGWYYIYIYAESDYNSTQAYTLQVSASAQP